MSTDFERFLLTVIGGAAFGIWQNSVAASTFMGVFIIVMLIPTRPKK